MNLITIAKAGFLLAVLIPQVEPASFWLDNANSPAVEEPLYVVKSQDDEEQVCRKVFVPSNALMGSGYFKQVCVNKMKLMGLLKTIDGLLNEYKVCFIGASNQLFLVATKRF